ncbi:hypothetical protein [Algoriphagus namhaensis]
MGEPEKRQIKGHRIRKKILRFFIGIFLAILFLEFVVYFGSNLFLANWARTKVNEASNQVYTIDFNRLNISLIRRGVFVDGIVMQPLPDVEAGEGQTLFDFSLDQLAFKGSWYSWEENIFYLGKLEFDNPNVKLTLAKNPKDSTSRPQSPNRESPVASLERELRKTIDKTRLNALMIREIEINNADLFFLNFLSDNSLRVEDSKLLIKEVNWTTQEEWETPFNAKGFEFEMERGEFFLPDGVHQLKAKRIFISSLEEVIDLEDFEIVADRSQPSRNYYNLSLEELLLKEVDLNQAFSTSELEIEEIVLNAPDFNIAHTVRQLKENPGEGDLNDLIKGILKSLKIKELSINQGRFVSADASDSLKNRIELERLDFKMVKFYLGDEAELKENQFFYGQDASMEIDEVSVYLSDGVHLIEGDRVKVNSFTNEIVVEGFTVEPRTQRPKELEPNVLLSIRLPQLMISEADLKKFYNEGIFDISDLRVKSPTIEITENQKPTSEATSTNSVNQLLEGFLSQLRIDTFNVEDGVISFTNATGIRSDDVGFDRFSLLLEDVLVEPDKIQNSKEFFLANELVLDLDNYRLKLRDNLHEFMAEKVIIDSKNERVELQNFRIQPQDSLQIQQLLDTYGKTAVLDLDIPYFAAEGIDLRRAFFEEELRIGFITIPSSVISLDRYAKKKRTNTGSLSSDNDLSDLLTQYFVSITVDSLNFLEGDLSYQNFAGEKDISISEDDLSIRLKNFHVERGLDQQEDQTFFSDEIDVNFKDYSFSLAGGNYTVNTNNLRFNSKDRRIEIENLSLVPSPTLQSQVILSVNLPEVVLEGVNIDRFLFDNVLELQKLKVVGSELDVEIDPEMRKLARERQRDPNRNTTLPKAIDRILIDSIQADQSFLKLEYLLGETDLESIETRFDLFIQGFNLDSISASDENVSELFDQITFNLQDFSFALPDSVHTLKFSDVELNTETEESVFRNFQIIPNDIRGKVGKPVVAASIDAVAVQNNRLSDILASGTFNLTQLALTNPQVKIYLDADGDSRAGSSETVVVPRQERAQGLINSVILDDVIFKEGAVSVYNKRAQPLPKLDFKGINLTLSDLGLELIRQKPDLGPEFFLDQDLNVSLRNYALLSEDSLTKISIGKISFVAETVQLEDIWFRPVVGRYDYLRTLGYQTDAIEARVERVLLRDIDLPVFAQERKIVARNLEVDGLGMDIFRDKRLPRREGIIKPMPQQVFQSAPIYLEVDSLLIKNSRVTYQEFAPKALLVGSLDFEEINASIAPFVLTPDSVDYPLERAILEATALIEGQGDVTMTADMRFDAPYMMEVDARLGEFDLTRANRMLEHTSFVGVRSGRVVNGKWKFKINEDEAWGKMRFFYEDLKVDFLDTLTLEPGKGRLALMTFAANTAVKNSNPRGLFKKKVSKKIYHERDKAKFIFGGWWRATFSGLKGSVGLGKAKMPKRKEEEEFYLEEN